MRYVVSGDFFIPLSHTNSITMATISEELLEDIKRHLASARGQAGSKILNTGATATGNIIAIVSCGTTYQVGACVGNCDGIVSGRTFLGPFQIEGVFSSVTAGPLVTDEVIVYFGL